MPTDLQIRAGIADANGLKIAYEDIGNPNDPPMLLIMGFSAQLTAWPLPLVERLVEGGNRVIRFDNRDIGLSSKMSGARVEGSNVVRAAQFWTLGRPAKVPYTLVDMAKDAVGVLDHLGIESANVVGASMGGMIAQIVAAEHPDRVRTLSLVFTTTNEPFLPPPSARCFNALFGGPGAKAGRAERIDFSVRFMKSIGGRKYPLSDAQIQDEAEKNYERSYYPAGIVRQLAATIGTGSLVEYTKRIKSPTVILHGTDDPLVRPQGGKAIARRIPHARLHLIEGWGHNFPGELIPDIAAILLNNAAKGR